ncbi:MAG TPA: YdeI/OmpD-associated family protein [Polyangiaceae bacterium]|nr:YdeI/OmpD-associated family protein [Polyangiaceae bacterium]
MATPGALAPLGSRTAGLQGNETLRVTLELDTEQRVVEPPAELVKALKAGKVLERFRALSYTHQRELVEAITSARKPETRARRIATTVKTLQAGRTKR